MFTGSHGSGLDYSREIRRGAFIRGGKYYHQVGPLFEEIINQGMAIIQGNMIKHFCCNAYTAN